MSSKVEISVRSRLDKIVEDLNKISKEAQKVGESMQDASKAIGETQQDQVRKTENFLGRLRRLGATTSKEIKDDFKALLSLEGVGAGLKISDQFKKNVKETVHLSDSIRRLGSVFGISKDHFASFQTKLVQGLGLIGLSSESATRSLEGLSKTQVRGQDNLKEYALLAGQLSQTAGEAGGEANIAQGMASVLTARGQDPNDMKAAKSLAEDLRKGFNATGMSATEILGTMEEMYAGMSQDFRKSISTKAMVSMAVTRQVAGPQSTAFLEEYLKKSPTARMAWDARGFKGVFGKNGFDTEKFRKSAGGLMSEYKNDPRLMAQTMGLSEDAAEGFVRLYESLDRVAAAQDKMARSTGNLEEQYRASMSMSQAFEASLNRTKSMLASPLAAVTNGATNLLAKASESGAGAAAVTGGSAVAAAMLAGGGLKGLLGMAKGGLKASAYEAVTGEKVTPVNVVNAGEIGSSISGGIMPMIGKTLALGAAGAAGYAGGTVLSDWLAGNTQGTTKEGFKGDIVEQGMFKIADVFSRINWGAIGENIKNVGTGRPTESIMNERQPGYSINTPGRDMGIKIKVETAPNLKAQVKTNRGAAQ